MAARKSGIDTGLIKDLANLLTDTDLSEIEVEEGDLRIRLARGGQMTAVTTVPVSSTAPPVSREAPQTSATTADAPSKDAKAQAGNTVNSPMVGTAYMASAPGAEPYVQVGDKVRAGQTVMIIEAMKTMNQIPATQDGTIAEILVEDGQPVEFGEALVVIE